MTFDPPKIKAEGERGTFSHVIDVNNASHFTSLCIATKRTMHVPSNESITSHRSPYTYMYSDMITVITVTRLIQATTIRLLSFRSPVVLSSFHGASWHHWSSSRPLWRCSFGLVSDLFVLQPSVLGFMPAF